MQARRTRSTERGRRARWPRAPRAAGPAPVPSGPQCPGRGYRDPAERPPATRSPATRPRTRAPHPPPGRRARRACRSACRGPHTRRKQCRRPTAARAWDLGVRRVRLRRATPARFPPTWCQRYQVDAPPHAPRQPGSWSPSCAFPCSRHEFSRRQCQGLISSSTPFIDLTGRIPAAINRPRREPAGRPGGDHHVWPPIRPGPGRNRAGRTGPAWRLWCRSPGR